jgi:hypothetical protein
MGCRARSSVLGRQVGAEVEERCTCSCLEVGARVGEGVGGMLSVLVDGCARASC